jgi:hypothetical protein
MSQSHGQSTEFIPELHWVPRPLDVGRDALGLDHLSAFVLHHVDGASDVEAIAYTSGIPRLEVLAILRELERHGAIELGTPKR